MKIKVAVLAAGISFAGLAPGIGLMVAAAPAQAQVCIGLTRFPEQKNIIDQCGGCVSFEQTNDDLMMNGLRPITFDAYRDFAIDRHGRHSVDLSQYC
jgi:hypothetical protein